MKRWVSVHGNTIDHGFSGCQNLVLNGERAHVFLATTRQARRRAREIRRFNAQGRSDPFRGGISKTALAAELETTTGAIRNWMTGRAISQKQTVNKIAVFLAASIISAQLGAAFRGFGLRSNTRICLDTMWTVWFLTAPSQLWRRQSGLRFRFCSPP